VVEACRLILERWAEPTDLLVARCPLTRKGHWFKSSIAHHKFIVRNTDIVDAVKRLILAAFLFLINYG
jgi:hypothetical protein